MSERVGYRVRLADEAEWEWAARSAQPGNRYPWGAEWREGVANTSASKLQKTTAVGMYPTGDSEQQVTDLTGNVWEWCLNEYASGTGWRVLRGGAWDLNRGLARAEDRHLNHPGYRYDFVGFRVVCSSPSAEHRGAVHWPLFRCPL